MARAIWKGSISFGLVNIPIALYPATRREELKFRLLRKADLSPVNYKRVAEKDGKEVPWDQIVKGYEYEKGKYVVLRDDDFQRVDLEATQTVDIQDFVDLEEIDPMFFYKPYYLEPQKGGDKAYALLRDALKDTNKVGVAKVVIKTRQYLAGVKPEDGALVLELMHFADELADPEKLHVPKKLEVGKREMNMAKSLIGSKGNRRKAKESAEADKGDRSGIGFAEELGANRHEEKSVDQIAQETEATCKKSSVRWIGFSEDDGEGNRRRRGFEAAKPHSSPNALRTRVHR